MEKKDRNLMKQVLKCKKVRYNLIRELDKLKRMEGFETLNSRFSSEGLRKFGDKLDEAIILLNKNVL